MGHLIEARAFDGTLYSEAASADFTVFKPEPGVSMAGDSWFPPAILAVIFAGMAVSMLLSKRMR